MKFNILWLFIILFMKWIKIHMSTKFGLYSRVETRVCLIFAIKQIDAIKLLMLKDFPFS